jgi:hypothetical protein
LGGDPGARIGLGEPPVLDEAGHPKLLVGVNDDDQREHRRHLRFDEQRDVLDDYRVRRCRVDQLLATPSDQRMHYAVQGGPLRIVAEGDGCQRRPVQRAVRAQDALAEGLDQLRETLRSGFDDLPCNDVAVDHDPAEFAERPGHRRLAGTDTAGQTNSQHGISLTGGAGHLALDARQLDRRVR